MKRLLVLVAIVCTGLSLMAAGLIAQQAGQRGAGTPPGQGAGERGRGGGGGGVGKIMQVADRLYMIPGAGGNSAVFVTANGVVLVDTKLATMVRRSWTRSNR